MVRRGMKELSFRRRSRRSMRIVSSVQSGYLLMPPRLKNKFTIRSWD
jgi:hypothetical protein